MADLDELIRVLERAQTILANMAKENPPKIMFGFQRWPISHEVLRADARNLLPAIETVLGGRT